MAIEKQGAFMQLLAEGEIWPGMRAEEFAARRKRLADALPPGGIAIIPAASRTLMTGAIPYAYRQASHPCCCLCMCLTHVLPNVNLGGMAIISAASQCAQFLLLEDRQVFHALRSPALCHEAARIGSRTHCQLSHGLAISALS